MPRLSTESLNFAKNHIKYLWDSDFWLRPFEFKALWAHWHEVVEHLVSDSIRNLPAHPPRALVAPKPDGGYRVVHQLHPLDALVYTAITHMVANDIERGRVPVEHRVACSFRIQLDNEKGRFFEKKGYDDFSAKALELTTQYPYVMITDITDFYNQIYLHRLQNAISALDQDLEPLASALEDFLTRMNNRVSRGVPVGPTPSIIMAEAILMDVDNFIQDKRFDHTRYVDDFYIFGASTTELQRLQRELVLYLHSNHRLTLASGKTKILSSDEFIAGVLEDPERLERDELHKALREKVASISSFAFQGVDDPEIEKPNISVEERIEVLQALMNHMCSQDRLDLGLARHVLRTCRRLRLRAIASQLLDHFDLFAPAINDVVLYLREVSSKSFLQRYADQLEYVGRTSQTLEADLVANWFFDYIANQDRLIQEDRFRALIRDRGDFQSQASLARQTRNIAWVRQYRDRLDELGDWNRRQVIYTSKPRLFMTAA